MNNKEQYQEPILELLRLNLGMTRLLTEFSSADLEPEDLTDGGAW